jgi:hypothetical protein
MLVFMYLLAQPFIIIICWCCDGCKY